MRSRLVIMVTSILLFFAPVVVAIQSARTVDPRPMERPKPLCSIRGDKVRPTLQVVVSTLQAAGFTIEQTNWDTGEVFAKRSSGDGENRVLAWLEWDIARPGEQFNLFLSSGRYERFFGTSEFKRVMLDSSEEQQQFGSVRQRLIHEALIRG